MLLRPWLWKCDDTIRSCHAARRLIHQPRPPVGGGRIAHCCRLAGILRRGAFWPDNATTISQGWGNTNHGQRYSDERERSVLISEYFGSPNQCQSLT